MQLLNHCSLDHTEQISISLCPTHYGTSPKNVNQLLVGEATRFVDLCRLSAQLLCRNLFFLHFY